MKRRARAKWYTVETCGRYELQTNQYEEHRVLFCGMVMKNFYNINDAYAKCKHYWKSCQTLEGQG